MIVSNFQRIVLSLAGITVLLIGGFITLEPHLFYSSYGIMLGNDPDLLSEVRGPGANLAGLGALIILGLFKRTFARTSIIVAKVIFIAFPIGRLVGILADGIPSHEILTVLAIEIVIGILLFIAFRKKQ